MDIPLTRKVLVEKKSDEEKPDEEVINAKRIINEASKTKNHLGLWKLLVQGIYKMKHD